MAEKFNSIDTKILELLRSGRAAAQQEIEDRAQAAFEQTRLEAEQETLEGYLGSMMLDLKGRMVQDYKTRMQSHHGRRLDAEARKVAKEYPALINKHTARKLLEKRQRAADYLHTGPIFPLEADGVPGEQIAQDWRLRLDLRPMPPAVSVRIASFIRLQREQAEEAQPDLVHEMRLYEHSPGHRSLRVEEGDRPLQGNELYVPLGLILAAQELYPPIKNPR